VQGVTDSPEVPRRERRLQESSEAQRVRMRRRLIQLGALVAVALVTTSLLRAFVIQTFSVPSESMEPTLIPGQVLVVGMQTKEDLARGDIVVFADVDGWLGEGDDFLVKRVIGLPGDTVKCCSTAGQLIVNGAAIEETYLADIAAPASSTEFEVVVPEGRIWVMGDNRALSADSRSHATVDQGAGDGTVAIDSVVGRVLLTVASPFSPVDRAQDAFRGVPPGTG